MAELDLIRFEEEQKKNHLKKLINDKEFKYECVIAACNITGAVVFENILSKAWFTFLQIMRLPKFKVINKRVLSEEEKELENTARDSITYQELKSAYEEYINNIVNLIKIFKLENSKETMLFLQILMENGLLSESLKHEYYKYEHYKELTPELLGAKIVTGKSVCRHMSTLFVNVLNNLGYPSANMHCHLEKGNPIERLKKGNVELDHSIVATYDKGEKYLFDPTHILFATTPSGIDMSTEESTYVAEYVDKENKDNENRYLIINPYTREDELNSKDTCSLLNNARIARITNGEFEYLLAKMVRLQSTNDKIIIDFTMRNHNLAVKIANLTRELMPSSDKPITKHLIRK